MGDEFGEHWCRRMTRFKMKPAMRGGDHFVLLRLEAGPTLRPLPEPRTLDQGSHQDAQSSQGPPLEFLELALTPSEAIYLGQELHRLGRETSGSVH